MLARDAQRFDHHSFVVGYLAKQYTINEK